MAALAEWTRLRPATFDAEINGLPIPLGPWEPSRAQPGTLRPFPTRGGSCVPCRRQLMPDRRLPITRRD